MERRKISLDVLNVAEPCTENWGAMRGDERVRFCDLCHRNVYNLSAMTREQADDLVSTHEGRLCVRFYKRADGSVTTSDCAPDRLAAARRSARRALTWAGAMAGGFLALVGLGGFAASHAHQETVMMGEPAYDMGRIQPERPREIEVMGDVGEELPQNDSNVR